MQKKKVKDQLPGGKGDNRPDSDFCPKALKEGQKHEMEHTQDPALANEIAKDHLSEDAEYYKKLKKIEKSCGVNSLEAMCNNCGSCCKVSVPYNSDGDRVIVKGLKCKYLAASDDGRSMCSVYKSRFKDAPWCLSLMKGFDYGSYPSNGSCPYTQFKKGYRGQVELSDEEYALIEPTIIKSFIERGQPEWCSDLDWMRFTSRLTSRNLLKSVQQAPVCSLTTQFDGKIKDQ